MPRFNKQIRSSTYTWNVCVGKTRYVSDDMCAWCRKLIDTIEISTFWTDNP